MMKSHDKVTFSFTLPYWFMIVMAIWLGMTWFTSTMRTIIDLYLKYQ